MWDGLMVRSGSWVPTSHHQTRRCTMPCMDSAMILVLVHVASSARGLQGAQTRKVPRYTQMHGINGYEVELIEPGIE